MMLSQIIEITLMNLRNLPARAAGSMVVIVGIAGVVGVLVSVMTLSTGLEDLLSNTGEGERILVLREGATSEVGSFIPINTTELIKTTDGVAQFDDGNPMASVEMSWSLSRYRKRDDSRVDLNLRGIDLDALAIRPGIKLIDGRLPTPGLQELMVGEVTRLQFQDMEIGDLIPVRNGEWEVVGIFESHDMLETGMIGDRKLLMSVFERANANSVRVVLEDGVTLNDFKESLEAHGSLLLHAQTEEEYYSDAKGQAGALLDVVSGAIGVIMAIGAIFGALNTMYSAVSARSVEIATLRAIGFGRTCVVISVMTEALVLAIIGALVGVTLATMFFSGDLVSLGPVSYRLVIDQDLMTTGVIWACAIGIVGGLFPAIHAARMPVVTALRQL